MNNVCAQVFFFCFVYLHIFTVVFKDIKVQDLLNMKKICSIKNNILINMEQQQLS